MKRSAASSLSRILSPSRVLLPIIAGACLSAPGAIAQVSSAVQQPIAQQPATQQQPTQQPAPAQAPADQAPTSAQPAPNSAPATQDQGEPQPSAQPPSADDQGSMFVFKKQVEEVVLHATVTDDQQHLVTGLDRSAFQVFERGVPQEITSFRREDVPVAMGIVVDNSGSMRDKRDKINQAVLNLVRASNPKDEIFVVNFGTQPYLDQDFTSNVKLLETALHQVSAKGSTALYDAIVASAIHLRSNSRLQKQVLLVITDGQDNMSEETLQEASRRLQQVNGPTLYSIGLLGMEGRGREALQYLSDRTGGVAYFPASLNDVDDITRTVAHDIRSQYMIAYRPHNQNAQPGYESVRVEAHAPNYGKLTVRTQSGYFNK
jgi:Ca-activated chloride channel homolog